MKLLNTFLFSLAVIVCLLLNSAISSNADDILKDLGESYNAVATDVAPSIALIKVTRKAGSEKQYKQVDDPSTSMNNSQYFIRPDSPVSGVIIDKEGHILTSNYNVTGGEIESITVTLADGSSHEASVLGRHENWDIALLKIETDLEFTPVSIREEVSTLGQFAMVVGKSQSYQEHTITTGIVSAHDRLRGSAVQTSCRINFGNTGGALVDLDGKLIGITSRMVPGNRAGMNSGVGFAVPWDKILEILPELKAKKIWKQTKSGISGPFLGIGMSNPQPENCPGIEIDRVIPGSAAEAMGLLPGDIIIQLNATVIKNVKQISKIIRSSKVGDTLYVVYLRNSKRHEGKAILQERPSDY